MSGQKGKGGKNPRKYRKNTEDVKTRELQFRENDQQYGKVIRHLGNCRVDVCCADGQRRLCHIPGKLVRKIWINVGDLVLINVRDYQDSKGDILLKYSEEEARRLRALRETSPAMFGEEEEEEVLGNSCSPPSSPNPTSPPSSRDPSPVSVRADTQKG